MTSTLYVIMPVGSDDAYPLRRAAIERGAVPVGYRVHFPLDRSSKGTFSLATAKRDLKASAAVLADLTNERPSCYYEVGLAQAVNPRVLIVAQQGTPLHQIAGREEVLFYDSIDALPELLSKSLPPVGQHPKR